MSHRLGASWIPVLLRGRVHSARRFVVESGHDGQVETQSELALKVARARTRCGIQFDLQGAIVWGPERALDAGFDLCNECERTWPRIVK